jgi:sulfur relay (sulfurtransferase) DsrF/TusC family protein
VARSVVSVVRSTTGGLRAGEPVLEANAYAVAEELDLALVLLHDAVELAVAGAEVVPTELAGVPLPPAAAAQDLLALVESGVGVYAGATALLERGIAPQLLAPGVAVVDDEQVADLLRTADAVLTW